MARKTIPVKRIVERANVMFKESKCNAVDRKAVAFFVANILHETRNYNGFMYLDSETNIHGGHYGKDGRIKFI